MGAKRSRAIDVARAIACAPPLWGALYLCALVAWAGRRGAGDDADLGDLRRVDAFETFVVRRFAAEVASMRIALIATAVALGVGLGLVADILVHVRRAMDSARPVDARPARGGSPGWRRFVIAAGEGLAVVMLLHCLLVLWGMADSPQLYATRWYATGGAARTVQILATDVLGTRGVVIVAIVAALAYVRVWRGVAVVRAWLTKAVALRSVGVVGIGALLRLAGASGADVEPRSGAPEAARVNAFAGPVAPVVLAAPAPSTAAGVAVSSPSNRARPNVLVLAVDSLRDDRLNPRLAPNLAALASRGTRFDRAYVSLPRTFPSWVTILTGRHGHRHGIRTMFPTWDDRARDFDALPARFGKAGYRTAVVSDYAGDIFTRIDLGFARVDTPSFDFRELVRQRALERETPLLPVLHSRAGRLLFPVMRELSDAADPRLLAADVDAALDRVKEGPFFMTVFFSTAHFPYAAPAPYYAKYTDPAYRGPFKYHAPVGLGPSVTPSDADVGQIRALYDGAITAIDDAVARVLHSLESSGVADRTILVVTADHGENLWEDGRGQGHGDHLFGDAVTHVPLAIVDPRVKGSGARVSAIVRDVDIAATLYSLAAVPPPPDLDGQSLAATVRGEAAPMPRLAYAESELWFTEEVHGVASELRMPYPGIMGLTEIDTKHHSEIVLRRDMEAVTTMARHRMVRDERWKLVYVPTRTGVRYMLFDTRSDPDEKTDVAADHPAEVLRLRSELWAWMLADPRMEQRSGFLVPREATR